MIDDDNPDGKIEFTYQYSQRYPKTGVTISPDSDIADVLKAFELFLLGAGYRFEGQLDFVDNDGKLIEDKNEDTVS